MAKSLLNVADITAKWERNATSAVTDYIAGAKNVKVAPGIKAAAASAKMKANIIESIDSGKWGKRVAAVSLGDWQNAVETKGGARYGAGITASVPKMQAAMSKIIPHIQAGLTEIEKMPTLTLDQSIAKMVSWTRHMAKLSVG